MSTEKAGMEQDPFRIEEIHYEEDESVLFDEKLRSKEHLFARQDSLTESTDGKMLMSGWHVPCHCIITRTEGGKFRAFHVQPNKLGSFLTFDQEKALREVGKEGGSAIVAKGGRSWFGPADQKELEGFKIKVDRVIDVKTNNWWRLLFDPETNEVWIDVRDKQTLTKYRGF